MRFDLLRHLFVKSYDREDAYRKLKKSVPLFFVLFGSAVFAHASLATDAPSATRIEMSQDCYEAGTERQSKQQAKKCLRSSRNTNNRLIELAEQRGKANSRRKSDRRTKARPVLGPDSRGMYAELYRMQEELNRKPIVRPDKARPTTNN